MLNLKKRQMSFENDTLREVVPLDPYMGDWYNELMDKDACTSVIEKIYKIMGPREDYINPTTNGESSCRSAKSYDMDFEDVMDGW
jgi:hypothetical protein